MPTENSFSDTALWNKSPHGMIIGETFESIVKNLEEAQAKELHEQDKIISTLEDETYIKRITALLKDVVSGDSYDGDEDGVKYRYIHNSYLVDTSVGGMDAINPHWQFGIDDDIRHVNMLTAPNELTENEANKKAKQGLIGGMGRVYHEMYYLNQKNIYMSFGVPQYYNIGEFIKNSVDSDTSRLANTGEVGLFAGLSELLKGKVLSFSAGSTVMNYWTQAKSLLRVATGSGPINKFYGMKPTMPIYYRQVNTLLGIMAVNMNLYPDFDVASLLAKNGESANEKNYPPVLQNGPDIYAILDKRRRMASKGKDLRTTDQMITKAKEKKAGMEGDGKIKQSFMENFFSNADDIAHDLFRHVAFRLESGESPSETMNNQTGQSALASTINSAASAARDKSFTVEAISAGDAWYSRAAGSVDEILKDIGKAVTGSTAVEILVSGNGYVDIPEVWKSSSFTKSQSFTIQLRARAGDKISIFQSIYIPLCMLIAAASPRGIGETAYTQPFLLEAYAAGLYSVPLGIIESLTIKRGASEFGWTYEDLPTSVDVTVNLKDLTPVMFLSLMNPTKGIDKILNSNTGMLDYLNTLSGMSLSNRIYMYQRLKRLRRAMFLVAKTTILNPIHYSDMLGNTALAKLKAAVDAKPRFIPSN